MTCNKCNHNLPEDSGFCQYCGCKLENLDIASIETVVNTFQNGDVSASNDEPNIDDMTPDEALNVILKMQAQATIEAMEANAKEQPNNENDPDFGLVPEKPIFTHALQSIDGEEAYLDNLYTIKGEKIKYNRRGSTSVNGINGMIDIYETFLPDGQPYKTIYINMYGAKSSTKAPADFVLMQSDTKETKVKATKQKEPKVHKPKKIVNKKLIVWLTVIPIAIILITLLVVFLVIPALKYNHAQKLLENGNYELAYSAFENLAGYSDSEEMLLECRYVQAVKYRDAGDYDLSNKIFESLGDYRDSKILIHKHEYRVASRTESTCTENGCEVFKCTGCESSYTNVLIASHSYANTSTIDATCTAAGTKVFECSVCRDTYSEVIAIKSHDYSEAICTKPKECTVCGKTDGTALGHTNSVICHRCGVNTFEKLLFSGYGPSYITDINLPEGTYNIIFTHNGQHNYVAYFTGGSYSNDLAVNEIGTVSYIYRVESGKWLGEIVQNGYINITMADGYWTVTIEAVEN